MSFPSSSSGPRALPPPWLVIALLALPQVAETILAPALPDLARHWRLDAAATQPVMGIFFVGFAAGVLLWGHLADTRGRRPAMLAGLALGLAGTLCALAAPAYPWLLAGRFLQALGLAACSVVTQTVLRDCLDGPRLTHYFVTLGTVLAWSPAVGPLTGQVLADGHGYGGVLTAIAVVVALLLGAVAWRWRETRPAPTSAVPLAALARRMLADGALRLAVQRVAGLNLLVFSFYAAGPFMTGSLPGLGFGWVGLGVALAGSLGAACNRRLPATAGAAIRVRHGLRCVALGAAAQALAMAWRPQPGWLWAAAALPVFIGYGLAIPNLLGPALRRYGHCLGRAGALFGLAYYSLLGLGLAATSWLPFDTPLPLSAAWLAVALWLLAARERD
ncbi:MFS transporter [Achromobacter xylosoxidans]|uniref:MFS transporter n=3 Tax=Alcaligenes xylosoxydans xylosoxydans TaxID=85698 RepID=UPI0006C690EE|nr:MFS transporter [Achromobacter xylosoxidans]MCH4573643.1 MFS transporter [Achromobacter xylosoxidans]MDD7992166.1 MFS transporter [Achromobacter xylosoxidans]OFO65572.1 MFS transporter [Achromobacter xylosoxidans]OMG88556.1 MFS transporter [Achromobacter xylosoxidans]PNL95541.1 MFS transporter [Achromobacter xylosoxidans]